MLCKQLSCSKGLDYLLVLFLYKSPLVAMPVNIPRVEINWEQVYLNLSIQ